MGRMTRKEKCWQCDRRRSDVTLRMCDDRLCQDCDNVNRAVSEGRASGSADKSSVTDTVTVTVSDGTATGTTNHAVSYTESANTTTSTPKPLIRNMIRNELLCYVFNNMDQVVHDSLVKVCTDFYDTKAIETAKRVPYSCAAVIDCGVRHQRRQGPSKDKANMEDILLAFHRCSDLPEFVASDLSRLPPLSMHNIDFAHLLHEFQGMRAEMTKLRGEVKLVKVNTQVPQRDGPWSKLNKVASAVNIICPWWSTCLQRLWKSPQRRLPRRRMPPKVVKRAVVSSETCEPEPVGNQQHDESDEDGFTRVSRKRPARAKPKAVIGTKCGVSLKARSGRFVCVFVMMDSHKLATKCTQLTTKHDSYASYKVEVMCDNVAELYNPEKWPTGVYLRKFFRQNV